MGRIVPNVRILPIGGCGSALALSMYVQRTVSKIKSWTRYTIESAECIHAEQCYMVGSSTEDIGNGCVV